MIRTLYPGCIVRQQLQDFYKQNGYPSILELKRSMHTAFKSFWIVLDINYCNACQPWSHTDYLEKLKKKFILRFTWVLLIWMFVCRGGVHPGLNIFKAPKNILSSGKGLLQSFLMYNIVLFAFPFARDSFAHLLPRVIYPSQPSPAVILLGSSPTN